MEEFLKTSETLIIFNVYENEQLPMFYLKNQTRLKNHIGNITKY